MGNFIKDGTGKGYLARVDCHNLLYTFSVGMSVAAHECLKGNTYLISSPLMNITTTQGLIGWNLYSGDHALAIDKINIYWNGGSTNYNRPLEVEFKAGDGLPTTNISSISIGNTYIGSPKTLEATALYWNGTGTGMTGHTSGASVGANICSVGINTFDINGSFIVASGTTLSTYARGEEAGKVSFAVWAYEYNDNDTH